MNYFINLTLDGGNGPIDLERYYFEYTTNLSEFFNDVLVRGSLGQFKALEELDGQCAGSLLLMFEHLFAHISASQYKSFKKYNPKNNWGSVHGAICFLANVAMACAKIPNGRLKVGRC